MDPRSLDNSGKGTFGSVYQTRLNSGRTVAIKSQMLKDLNGELCVSPILEVDALLKLRTSGVTAWLEGVILDGSTLRMILEPMICNLEFYVKATNALIRTLQFPEFLRSMLTTLSILERHGINHFDIKPQNILVGSGATFKLADFGLARSGTFVPIGAAKVNLYTVWFRPPEMLDLTLPYPFICF